MIDRFKKAKKIALESILPVANFRIITSEIRALNGGITEIPVTVEFNKEHRPPAEYCLSGGCFVHAFIRMGEKLIAINKNERRSMDETDVIRHIYLTDWDNAFLLSIVLNDGGEMFYQVTNEEVDALLKNCIHPYKE